jgi:beta-carotene ketolase (CrtW type)
MIQRDHKARLAPGQQAAALLIAFCIVTLWVTSLVLAMSMRHVWASPWPYLWMVLQTHLYTGMFITAHDAMHGSIHQSRKVNSAIGWICATLFAFNWYPKLYRKHHLHHAHPVTGEDPDFHPSGFVRWYLSFLFQYVTVWQILLMAIAFNLLILVFPKENVILFWMVPSLLSTLQLFYFGTYRPHRGEHAPDNKHRARSQRRNHLWAFVSCYFFGYHHEHHSHPGTPWWKLPSKKVG